MSSSTPSLPPSATHPTSSSFQALTLKQRSQGHLQQLAALLWAAAAPKALHVHKALPPAALALLRCTRCNCSTPLAAPALAAPGAGTCCCFRRCCCCSWLRRVPRLLHRQRQRRQISSICSATSSTNSRRWITVRCCCSRRQPAACRAQQPQQLAYRCVVQLRCGQLQGAGAVGGRGPSCC